MLCIDYSFLGIPFQKFRLAFSSKLEFGGLSCVAAWFAFNWSLCGYSSERYKYPPTLFHEPAAPWMGKHN